MAEFRTQQNRGTDALGRQSIQLIGPGVTEQIRAPEPHTSTTEQQAYLEGFAAAVKLLESLKQPSS